MKQASKRIEWTRWGKIYTIQHGIVHETQTHTYTSRDNDIKSSSCSSNSIQMHWTEKTGQRCGLQEIHEENVNPRDKHCMLYGPRHSMYFMCMCVCVCAFCFSILVYLYNVAFERSKVTKCFSFWQMNVSKKILCN